MSENKEIIEIIETDENVVKIIKNDTIIIDYDENNDEDFWD